MSLRRVDSPSASAILVLAFSCATAVHADTFGSGANRFDIEFVHIGNPGNAPDTTGRPNPAGSVDKAYRIGKFEISEQMIDKANALGGLGVTKDTRGPNKPATATSWNEAARFVNWLNTSSGSVPAYKFAVQPGEAGYSANANIELWTVVDAGYNPSNLYRNSSARYFLPSVDEWYKAAFYDPTTGVYFDFPAGSDSAPTAVASGTVAGTAVYGQSFFAGPADITLAGGLSPYGTMGQGGNVWEMEETDLDLVNGLTSSSSIRGFRGGDWYGETGFMHALGRNNGFPNYEDFRSSGFRVASIPEPSTLLLGAFVGLGLLAHRRVRRNSVYQVMRRNHAARMFSAAVAMIAAMILTAPSAPAAPLGGYVTVHGGPTYTPGVGGFKDGGGARVNDAGTAVGIAYKYNVSGGELGSRAFRWDGSGAAPTELGNLGTTPNGRTETSIFAINNSGNAVGNAEKYDRSGYHGSRAVRWNGTGTAPTELGHLGTTSFGFTYSYALTISDAGTAAGYAAKYSGADSDRGYRAVRWGAVGTVATELGNLGTDTNGSTSSNVVAINNVGTTVGWAEKYDGSGVDLGARAVRWDASGTAATELGNLGTQRSGYTDSSASAINNAGTAVGSAWTYDGSDTWLGARAIRWDPSGTAATELGNLGVSLSGFATSVAVDINDAGTAVGFASKFDGSGADLGGRAVRWDSSGTAATELGNLGANASGYTYCDAFAINDAGIIIGAANKYDDAGTHLGARPVYWGLDGAAVDLNTLIDPASGWKLDFADDISDTGWIGGHGKFDPDGPGGQQAYERLFLMHVPATPVPEPATVGLFGMGLVCLSAASRPRVQRNTVTAENNEN